MTRQIEMLSLCVAHVPKQTVRQAAVRVWRAVDDIIEPLRILMRCFACLLLQYQAARGTGPVWQLCAPARVHGHAASTAMRPQGR